MDGWIYCAEIMALVFEDYVKDDYKYAYGNDDDEGAGVALGCIGGF